MSTKLQFISVQEAERVNSSELFVYNSSNPKGVIHIDTREDGQNTTLSIPVTWIPFDATTSSTKTAVLRSPNFRKMVASGMVKIVHPDSAHEFMKDKDAQKEASRVYGMSAFAEESNIAANIAAAQDKIAENEGEVSTMVVNLCGADFDEDAAMTMVRNNQDVFTDKDWTYLNLNCQHAEVKRFAAEKMAEANIA